MTCSWVCLAAARRGRGEAAGFWPGWDMARLRRCLREGAAETVSESGRAAEGRARGRGCGGRGREAAFPTQPCARAGPPSPYRALPFLRGAGSGSRCSCPLALGPRRSARVLAWEPPGPAGLEKGAEGAVGFPHRAGAAAHWCNWTAARAWPVRAGESGGFGPFPAICPGLPNVAGQGLGRPDKEAEHTASGSVGASACL